MKSPQKSFQFRMAPSVVLVVALLPVRAVAAIRRGSPGCARRVSGLMDEWRRRQLVDRQQLVDGITADRRSERLHHDWSERTGTSCRSGCG